MSTQGIAYLALALALSVAALVAPLITYLVTRPQLRLYVSGANVEITEYHSEMSGGSVRHSHITNLEIAFQNDGYRTAFITRWTVGRDLGTEQAILWNVTGVQLGGFGVPPRDSRRFRVTLHTTAFREAVPDEAWADVDIVFSHKPFFFSNPVEETHRESLGHWRQMATGRWDREPGAEWRAGERR